MRPNVPPHWVPGQLLDLKRFTDGSYRATLLGEQYDPEKDNAIHFDSSHTAQQFVSEWYQRCFISREPHGTPS